MPSINLLVVAIKEGWRPLIDQSLHKAGYTSYIQYAENKKDAIRHCSNGKYDLLICGCTLPDGAVGDLVNVLGSSLPCLVMSEGICPMGNGNALSLIATNFFLTHADRTSWLDAMKSTMNEWEGRTQERIEQFHKENSDLYLNALKSCERKLLGSGERPEESQMQEICEYLTEILEVGRVSFYRKASKSEGVAEAVLVAGAIAPGAALFPNLTVDPHLTLFPRWDFLFSHRINIFSPFAVITEEERKWTGARNSQSLIAVPVTIDNAWEYFIMAEDLIDPRKWSIGEIDFLESLAGLIQAAWSDSADVMTDARRFSFPG